MFQNDFLQPFPSIKVISHLYANYTINEDGSTTEAQLKSTKKDSGIWKRIRKLIRKQPKDDDISQRVEIVEKRMKICMIKRQLKNDNVTDVSKKIKVEMNDESNE